MSPRHYQIELHDSDRSARCLVELRTAPARAESELHLLTRIFAYCFEYRPGIAFPPRGLSGGAVPAVWAHDDAARLTAWIEVGAPDWRRLQQAGRQTDRVAVYNYRDPDLVERQIGARRIERGVDISLYTIRRRFLEDLSAILPDRDELVVSRCDGRITVACMGGSLSSQLDERLLTRPVLGTGKSRPTA